MFRKQPRHCVVSQALSKPTMRVLLLLSLVVCAWSAPRQRPQQVTPSQIGCQYGGNFYPAGSTISEGTDQCGCTYGTYCTQDGGVIVGDCFPTCCIHEGNVIDHGNSYTDSSGAQCLCEWGQALCMAPPIVGCQMGDSFYPAGSTISEGTDQCGCTYGTYCTQDGHIVIGDCFPTCCVHEGSVIDHDSSFTDGAGAQCRCSWGQLECTISAISG
ncbi:PREDICTED: SCO-spondin-like [Branchiostoma belcheri]|uniref:SCO-spondin-like n=1 Tax=Branchiostoma belcheri TaxID=7741 RepID=A0A6P4YLP6_BRABE|nr:PREDICTED: SCO-spondin-like [Branchiostoma belcheri]